MSFDVEAVRKDFPVLAREVHGHPLVFLDSAASSQKPRQVLEAERVFVEEHYANVHRGVHTLSQEATDRYEAARSTVASFIGAAQDEVVFTKNVTESVNLVAYALGNPGSPVTLGPGDEIAVTEMEHHSNLVPWQMLAERTGATLRWLGITDEGRLDLSDLSEVVNERTRLFAFTHVSNLLGTENDLPVLVRRAKEVGALTFVDGAQAVPHQPVDVHALDVDFYGFTGHKMLAPSGVGVLWGRDLDALPPFMGGGSMIEVVQMTGTTYAKAPERFEAGTPVISQAVALAAACDYLTALGLDNVKQHEIALTQRLLDGIRALPGVSVLGPDTTEQRGSAVSFVVEGVHPHDVGQSLDDLGIAVRVGHHCAAPVCRRFGVPATARASSYVYNNEADIDALLEGIQQVQEFWSA
ncbi:MAG: cysteine desulfurase / selenocysteine lyase [Frankiales bacterium]|jgi:cysteine desulfurase/selenocysteine lyase|nr:cysteine desulfurase / selenocysteine lyase [Frankiales bacterium]